MKKANIGSKSKCVSTYLAKKLLVLLSLVLGICFSVGCANDQGGGDVDEDFSAADLASCPVPDVPTGISTVGSASVEFIGTYPDGYYNVVLDYAAAATRYQVGKDYAQALKQAMPGIEAFYACLVEQFDNYDTYMDRVKILKENMEADYREQIEGFASEFTGGTNDERDWKLSENEVFFYNTSAGDRINACSTIAVFGARSESGGTISARLHDWGEPMLTMAIFTHRNGPQSYLAISNLPTIIGGNTFINDDGMFMGGTESPTSAGYPDITTKVYGDGRIALEDSQTIEDAADNSISHNAMRSHTALISSPDDAKILEYSVEGMRALRSWDSELNAGLEWGFDNAVVAVNAFMLKGNTDNFMYNPVYGPTEFNKVRWNAYKTQLAAKGPTVTFDEMKEIATYNNNGNDYIYSNITQHIIIFDSATFRLEVYSRHNRPFTPDPNFWEVPISF